MSKQRCYQPVISRPLIAVLFHESKRQGIPMTHLMDRLLRTSLSDSPGWLAASQDWPELTTSQDTPQQQR
jgi:hypothetical protein